jgi:hypothetical protein
MSIKNTQNFKSVEIICKKCTQKKLFAKNFLKLIVLYRRGQIPILHPNFAYNFFVRKFFAFSQQF